MNRFSVASLVLVLTTACRTDPGNGGVPFSFTLDDGLVPSSPTLTAGAAGDSVVGVVVDSRGVASDLLVDEVILQPASPEELARFLTRVGGTVLWNDQVPLPPEGVQLRVPVEQLAAKRYTVRVDASAQPLTDFAATGEAYGLNGAYRFSSQAAAQLLALVAQTSAEGFKVSPVHVMHGDDLVFQTEENLLPDGGFNDALVQPYVTRTSGSRTGVGGAWQYLQHRGIVRRTTVAIFDSGFDLDGSGIPISNPAGDGTDYVGLPLQYDFLNNDYTAGGPGPALCSGGTPCPWHGQGAAGAAVGTVDNRKGAAGSGGTVAAPILFKMRTSADMQEWALRTAIAWGADVVNMSFGGACNEACREGKVDVGFYSTFNDARARGVVLVASAGNGVAGVGQDIDGVNKEPCRIPGVICVGALRPGTFDTKVGFSDFGEVVDLFAPTGIWTHPDGATPLMNRVFGGTSASAPWVAGVAAMMKSLKPALTSDEVQEILRRTAHLVPAVEVQRSLNALAAVIEVGGALPLDSDEPNDTAPAAIEVIRTGVLNPDGNAVLVDRTLHSAADRDHYRLVLHDHASINASLTYGRELATVYFDLVPEGETQPPVSPVRGLNSRGFGYGSPLLGPGSYRVVISGDNPQKYSLSLATITQPLGADVFEVNDTAGTAASPANGDHLATLHGEADLDWYRVVPTGVSSSERQVFLLEWADLPVNVDLLDVTGTTVLQSFPNVRTTPAIEITEERRIRITRTSGRARYGFTSDRMLSTAELGRLSTLTTDFWWLDFGNLKPGYVSDDDEWFVFVHSAQFSQPGVLLEGEGLDLELYDLDARLVARGDPLVSANGAASRRIDLVANPLVAGQHYALKVARTPELDASPQPESARKSPLGFSVWLGD